MQKAVEVVGDLRAHPGRSFTQACRDAGTTPRTVLRHGGSAFRRKGGRVVARKSDRLPRTLRHITATGLQTVTVRNSRLASRFAEHAAAVKQFLLSSDVSV